jgi:hypothetical protein
MQKQLDRDIDLVANMSPGLGIHFTFDINASMASGCEIGMTIIGSLKSWTCIKRDYIATIDSIRLNIRV